MFSRAPLCEGSNIASVLWCHPNVRAQYWSVGQNTRLVTPFILYRRVRVLTMAELVPLAVSTAIAVSIDGYGFLNFMIKS